ITASSTTSTRRNRFVFDKGRVSIISTISLIFATLFSSCTLNFFDCLTRLPYSGCTLYLSTKTVIVLSIESDTTFPVYTLRLFRSLMFVAPPLRINYLYLIHVHVQLFSNVQLIF